MDEDVLIVLDAWRGGADATETLGYLEEDAVRELAGALHVEDAVVRVRALQALARTRNSYALDAIMPFYRDPSPQVRLAALQAACDQGGDADPLSLQTFGELILSDPEPEVRRRAASTLGLIHSIRARTGLEKVLQDPTLSADLRALVEAQLSHF